VSILTLVNASSLLWALGVRY